ncbi:MAG: hypothetical protein UV61_C0008G0129 [Candidatus Gottesmanbacteria bacterium GW2011_GWB1_43_11]|uniref:Uncharacterized protein n=1 Tax=Candidatus Gottesmanbacteria bacterium GW2011_GWB1_43_11 TaxID=1618446 RepID=A0A0G1EUH4_9BACT|nr:MAG: hypothetical protein UV04_C0009G0038 [Candidatus Gottesmanbacteria bacterium GW2011_GWA2_42_16]KKS54971.1 MAG: hypothetical protein UV17_C0014G0054 [Candidatus Gottesmanbacteria bacterium GW2011_GWA1_42_26]KKS81447.1 MAG: hypothetical protein UV55_C0014G0036 [Candidatus Gottesmanbacteria bacterium GW2011_GWC1_43_10]KKS86676.1 MAG: hypothetical protein UV61_C0008G0129 [Candidatus Gottesmanbacteria bacterium GW2011_GWB1_43_11]OGG08549.1 MAG: hypothetical protein A2699_00005 [Candidatus Go
MIENIPYKLFKEDGIPGEPNPQTFDEWKAEFIAQMIQNASSCDKYSILTENAHFIVRTPGASIEGYIDLLFKLYEIHDPYCAFKHKK